MLQIIFKIVVTAAVFAGLYFFWMQEIDVPKTLLKPLSWIVTDSRKPAKLDVDFRQAGLARFSSPGGPFCLFLYAMHFVNTSGENVTVKDLLLRIDDGHAKPREIISTVIATGTTKTAKGGDIDSAVISFGPAVRIALIDWQNFRPVLARQQIVPPGGVFGGSAVFVLDISSAVELKKLKKVELIAIDYAGNKTSMAIELDPTWLAQAEVSVFENRPFESGPGQEFKWK